MSVPTLADPMQPVGASRWTRWRNRDYTLLWSGQTISAVGTPISQLALPLLVYAITGSVALTGLAGALEVVPYVCLSLPAGALVDRWDRTHVMVLRTTCRALALAVVLPGAGGGDHAPQPGASYALAQQRGSGALSSRGATRSTSLGIQARRGHFQAIF
jgi:MFS family permease